MKKYLVKLNRPVVIKASRNELLFKNIYGFFAPYRENNEKANKEMKKYIKEYVSYLAAVNCWSLNIIDDFSVNDDNNWLDRNGKEHYFWDGWCIAIADKCTKKISLDYEVLVLDYDEDDNACRNCGDDSSNITCERYMNYLVEIAKQQQPSCSAILFNHPIFLPKRILRDKECDGNESIYGVISSDADQTVGLDYLSYLSMCEEASLKGKTPNGYITVGAFNYSQWIDNDGNEHFAAQILDEANLCRETRGYEIAAVVENVPMDDVLGGVETDWIIDEDLYESLLKRADK